LFAAAILAAPARGQESGGQLQTSFQGYYLGTSGQPLIDTTGAAFRFTSFFPSLGFLEGSLEGYGAQDQVETGENYLQLRGAAWAGLRWTAAGGDFHLAESMVDFPFYNIYNPEIMARGGRVEAARGSAVFSLFYGREMLMQGPQLPFRVATPQTLAGASARFGVGKRFEYGLRLMRLESSASGIQNNPFLYPAGRQFLWTDSATAQANFHATRTLQFYAEGQRTEAARLTPLTGGSDAPWSYFAGAVWDTKNVTFRTNYSYQSTTYFPVAGYFAGDRRGPYAELRIKPNRAVELFSSASYYTNNLEHDPNAADYRTASVSVGASATLPKKWSFSAQASKLGVFSQAPGEAALDSTDYQFSGNVGKTLGRHSIRLTAIDLQLSQPGFNQRLRTEEAEDLVRLGALTLGGGIRWQQLSTSQTVNTLYYRGMAQGRVSRLTFNVDIEAGNDLVNQTVFATNTYRTEMAGVTLALGKKWTLAAQGFRNSLNQALNPENVFVLSGQGIGAPPILGGLNQWSALFRITKQFRWGADLPGTGAAGKLPAGQVPLRGAIEGVVSEDSMEGRFTAADVPVTLDGEATEYTDSSGRFHFPDVMEGQHSVRLSATELPAWYDAEGPEEVRVSVAPRHTARADLKVARLTSIGGSVAGPKDAQLDGIVIRLEPGTRYTTTEADGSYSFQNLREGDYQVALDASTLPDDSVLTTPARISAAPRRDRHVTLEDFRFEIRPKEKPVREIQIGPETPSPPAPAPAQLPAAPVRPQTAPPPAMPPADPQTSPPQAATPPAPVVKYGVQVGAFRSEENAENLRAAIGRRYGAARAMFRDRLWLVVVGEEATPREAQSLAARIRRDGNPTAFVVPVEP
jgi:cell division septation protein DedD